MDNLDSQELLHLAMYAASKDNHDDALSYLKQAERQEGENPHICLMLAAEYAEIGMFDRALQKFDDTIKLAPELKVAQLQAGLLLISLDRLEEAEDKLSNLKALGEDHYFGCFSLGLSLLIKENLENSLALLKRGCEINQENLPLNEDIKKIIEQIELRLNIEPVTVQSTDEDSSELLNSTYGN